MQELLRALEYAPQVAGIVIIAVLLMIMIKLLMGLKKEDVKTSSVVDKVSEVHIGPGTAAHNQCYQLMSGSVESQNRLLSDILSNQNGINTKQAIYNERILVLAGDIKDILNGVNEISFRQRNDETGKNRIVK